MKQLLIMMLGHPGSGKSYFAKQLAPKMGAVRFNGDNMRVHMFTDPKAAGDRANNPMVFGAIDYAVIEVLRAGYSAIYDAQHNHLAERDRDRRIADEFGAAAIIVWIKTPYEIALHRDTHRAESPDQRRKSDDHMRRSLEMHMKALETPGVGELLITLDGTLPFSQQYKSYTEQLSRLV
jgi:predicted kinase